MKFDNRYDSCNNLKVHYLRDFVNLMWLLSKVWILEIHSTSYEWTLGLQVIIISTIH